MRIAILVLLAAAPAWAQSKRYPPAPLDDDRQADAHSHVWESALDPERKPYADLVHEATELLHDGTAQSAAAAIDRLDAAIAKLPRDAQAYVVRGDAYLALHQWASCADDLGVAEDRAPAVETPEHAKLELELGICQGRAGRYADAERTLARTVASNRHGEQLMRLGEVRIALGKLDEAIDALTAAADAGEGPLAMTHWLLAAAYDRARRPSDADEHAKQASGLDRSFGAIELPPYPLLGVAEAEYLKGLAYRTMPKPEYSLMYFRRFLRLATDSPWRRRAQEHVREVTELPSQVERKSGSSALLDVDAARAIVHKAMPAMRACMAKLPSSVFEVVITRVGPHTPDAARDRVHVVPPPAGVTVTSALDVEPVATKDVAAVQQCIEPMAARLALPAPTERDTWYKAAFLVVSP